MVKQPLKMVDGYVEVPSGPGLGVELSEETLAKYRIA
jgi:L-alanine-DL-glutamate epimerase-like enolase superfamily enzyme